MVNVGVIGLGSMGNTHLAAYGSVPGCRVVAVADADEGRRTGRTGAGGNIEGQGSGGGFDFASVRAYADASELIADPEVHLVDVCLPTPLHARFAVAALRAGKHLMVEKPLARTAAEADTIVAAAEEASAGGQIAMCGMCMRFWPGWVWLKEAIDDGRFGRVLHARFRRVTSHPPGSFYADGDACGGALLDLHVHDTDFVRHAFGAPEAVFSRGYAKHTSRPDHVCTQYLFGDGGPVVTAEGGWAMHEGFGFEMQYAVNFERATAVFDIHQDPVLTLIDGEGKRAVDIPGGMGYQPELAYLIGCVERGEAPSTVTLADAANALRIVEAEGRSIASGRIEAL
ncbi:Gfo/Idh/MocA family protein [Phycisphaera mikurensis]|uniref:Putative oxidoreductase n=1 Tax=Phycisphaera mikurensis (strain NBRC 102666 / KCTC 22515 / FYK2301M01) TaxID=1142394 RepID=I0IDV0_PHYMF|nr:Gfo/Idh/MocA family oxidoreductase [Phycisphaera mikurensis]MBB6441248.1 putative dehydrogenase [Phycisphaera mikurensis]BAM03438.1 putative oxidoreductase [Phycisphaera mikurensis NBRC 102666]